MNHVPLLLRLLLAMCLLFPVTRAGAYAPQSRFIQDPEEILPFLQESADFWLSAWDTRDAAFFSDVGRDGRPQGTAKAFLAQSRNAYAMSKAFMVTGDPDYLFHADWALRYQYDFGWDAVNGGWWGQAGPSGSVNTGIWYNDSRWSFWQHYMLLGPSALVEATADPFHADWLERGNAINDLELWDDRPGFEGYFNDAALDWSWKSGKGFTPTVDAVTTNALTNYLLTRDPARLDRLVALGENIAYMITGDHGHIVSFPSEFDSEWQVLADSGSTSTGHHIKTAWCLARVFLMEPDPRYRELGARLLDEIWTFEGTNGLDPWDRENGIMRGNIDVFDGTVGGTADWWTVEQAVTGGLMNWYVSRKPEYLRMADEALSFFMEHYYDHENGEVFSVISNTGDLQNATKGNMFKAGYHSVELFYLVYLYGNLYYHNRPVTLHYRFDTADTERVVHLWPLAMEDDRLVIRSVLRDGEPYENVDTRQRDLVLPAGEEGLFSVTFESRYSTNPPAHFDDAWWRDWFGWYYHDREAWPWVYLNGAGWCYAFGNRKDQSGWFYLLAENRFFYTNGERFPLVYREGSGWDSL